MGQDEAADSGGGQFQSDDAAETWTEILALEGQMLGFALAPDGQKVAVGLKQGGVYVASTTDHVFSRVNDTGVRCLSWAQAGLYACGNQAQDGFTVGLSTDDGATFAALYDLLEIQLADCPAGTDNAESCPPLFSDLLDQLGGGEGAGGAPPSTASSASVGGASTAEPADGCSCRTSSADEAPIPLVLLLGLSSLLRSRNKRFEVFEDSRG